MAWQALEHGVSEGDVLLLENLVLKNNELHFGALSRMVRRRQAGERKGRVDWVRADGDVHSAEQNASDMAPKRHAEGAAVSIDGKEFSLPARQLLALLGITQVPPGVEIATVLSIKSSELAGKGARYVVSDGKLQWLSIKTGHK